MNPTLQSGRIKSPTIFARKTLSSRDSLFGTAGLRSGLRQAGPAAHPAELCVCLRGGAIPRIVRNSRKLPGAGTLPAVRTNSEAGSL
jgi:hypothetical protein